MIERICWWFYRKVQGIIAPRLKYAQTIYEDILYGSVSPADTWLDLGCGHNLLPSWRKESERALCKVPRFIAGLDFDAPSLGKHTGITSLVRGDITQLPFKDDSLSLITSNMVFEHLADPASGLLEIKRVLKHGGKLVFHTPNLLSYGTLGALLIPEFLKPCIIRWLEDRREEDVFRTYYRINTARKIRAVGQKTGFLVRIKMIMSCPQFVKFPPLLIPELLLIRLLLTSFGRYLRANIIATLTKP